MINYLYIFILACVLFSCQEQFDPKFGDDAQRIVVEGYIQSGDEALPPYVTISKTYPLFQPDTVITPQQYLGGAIVSVFDGDNTVQLTEICTQDLDPEVRAILLDNFGIDTILPGFNLCFYIDFLQEISPEIGKEYRLDIEFEGEDITAITSIPREVPIDSLKVFNQFNIEGFRQMNGFLKDPSGEDYYRIKVSVNGSNFAADFSSVIDDVFFDSKSFDFPVNKPIDREIDTFDPNTAGLFEVGDTVRIQWQNLTEEHFDFWNTLEFARGNQGPFSSYSRATTNISGGIGIWGGSTINYYDIIIE